MYQLTVLIGRIGLLKPASTPSGMAVTEFSVATSKSYFDKDSGQWAEKTQWHTCKTFKECAEYVRDNLSVGDLVQLQGELETRNYTDKKTGQERQVTELIVHNLPKKMPKFWTKDGSVNDFAQAGQLSQPQPMQQTTPMVTASLEPQPPVTQAQPDELGF